MEFDDIIILEAYRLIRQRSRDITDPMTNEQLGCYVRGVVDLQTEIWGNHKDKKPSNKK